jgi:hypothetical protein
VKSASGFRALPRALKVRVPESLEVTPILYVKDLAPAPVEKPTPLARVRSPGEESLGTLFSHVSHGNMGKWPYFSPWKMAKKKTENNKKWRTFSMA